MLKVAYRPDGPGVKFKLIVVDIMYDRKYGAMLVWSYIKKPKSSIFFSS